VYQQILIDAVLKNCKKRSKSRAGWEEYIKEAKVGIGL
jgi:hypothetical protein